MEDQKNQQNIGKFVAQKTGYRAFIPEKFPPFNVVNLPPRTENLLNKATLLLGKLDGIMQLLPDLDFFIFMYVRKEAALSSEIEGTQATMIDSIRAEVEKTSDLPKDVDRINHYIKAINYGLKRLEKLPLSLRLIKEIHSELLIGTDDAIGKTPGEFRTSQNWIGGATIATARFVPPPPEIAIESLNELENFMMSDKSELSPLIETALIHAQFETIHPFLDGNGRTGRLLITFYLCQQGILERPALYLSEYFKRHRELYFDLINAYHNKGEIIPWFNFFFQGVAEVSAQAFEVAKKVNILREKDIDRIHSFGRQVEIGHKVLKKIYELPIINVKKIEEWTGLSRPSANALVAKFVKSGILAQRDESKTYARQFEHKEYLSLF